MPSYHVEVRTALPPDAISRALAGVEVPEGKTRLESPRSILMHGSRLSWLQREDWLHTPESITAEFEQLNGPFSTFRGALRAEPAGDSWVIGFSVDFTTSIANWAGAVDRAIGGAVLTAAVAAVADVAGGDAVVSSGQHWISNRTAPRIVLGEAPSDVY